MLFPDKRELNNRIYVERIFESASAIFQDSDEILRISYGDSAFEKMNQPVLSE